MIAALLATRLRRSLVLVLAVGAIAQSADAESANAENTAPAGHGGREIDAQVDQYILSPSAEVHPRGTVYVSTHELLIWQLGAAVTDELQLSFTASYVPVAIETLPLLVTAKATVYRSAQFQLALQGGLVYVHRTPASRMPPGAVGALYGRHCYLDDCRGSVQLGLTTLVGLGVVDAPSDEPPSRPLVIISALAWHHRLGYGISLLGEAHVGWHVQGSGIEEQLRLRTQDLFGAVAVYEPSLLLFGGRWANDTWAVGLSALGLVNLDRAELDGPLPWLSATWRGRLFEFD